MGSHCLLQGIFPTQGSNPGLPHCRWILYHLGFSTLPSNPHFMEPESHRLKCQSGCVAHPLRTHQWCLTDYRTKSKVSHVTQDALLNWPLVTLLSPGLTGSIPNCHLTSFVSILNMHPKLQPRECPCLHLFTIVIPWPEESPHLWCLENRTLFSFKSRLDSPPGGSFLSLEAGIRSSPGFL